MNEGTPNTALEQPVVCFERVIIYFPFQKAGCLSEKTTGLRSTGTNSNHPTTDQQARKIS